MLAEYGLGRSDLSSSESEISSGHCWGGQVSTDNRQGRDKGGSFVGKEKTTGGREVGAATATAQRGCDTRERRQEESEHKFRVGKSNRG